MFESIGINVFFFAICDPYVDLLLFEEMNYHEYCIVTLSPLTDLLSLLCMRLLSILVLGATVNTIFRLISRECHISLLFIFYSALINIYREGRV
jgi:hypothetical protein